MDHCEIMTYMQSLAKVRLYNSFCLTFVSQNIIGQFQFTKIKQTFHLRDGSLWVFLPYLKQTSFCYHKISWNQDARIDVLYYFGKTLWALSVWIWFWGTKHQNIWLYKTLWYMSIYIWNLLHSVPLREEIKLKYAIPGSKPMPQLIFYHDSENLKSKYLLYKKHLGIFRYK